MLAGALFVFTMSIVPAIACLAVLLSAPARNEWLQILLGFGAFTVVWLAQAALIPAYRRDVRSAYAAVSMAWRRGS
jgi:hypothetical protein